MTAQLQLFMILGAVVLLLIIFAFLKRGLMSVKYSLLWLALAVGLVIAAAFPYVVYVLRVSALIEGLGTTYIPNFNGVKDILPLLRKNLVRALSGNENLLKLLAHEFVTAPITVRRLRTIVADLSENCGIRGPPGS